MTWGKWGKYILLILFFPPSLGVTVGTYQQSGAASLSETLLTFKVSGEYQIKENWDVGIAGGCPPSTILSKQKWMESEWSCLIWEQQQTRTTVLLMALLATRCLTMNGLPPCTPSIVLLRGSIALWHNKCNH